MRTLDILDPFFDTPYDADDDDIFTALSDAELRLDDAADRLEDVIEALYDTGDVEFLEQNIAHMARALGVVMPNKRMKVRGVSPLFRDMCAITKGMI